MKKILFVITLLFSHISQAALITWSTTSNTFGVNDIFTLDVIGTNFLVNVDGGGFDLLFDPNVLNILSVSIDAGVWDFATNAGTIDNVGGSLNGVAVNAFSPVTGNFTVASIQFQVVGAAGLNSALSLSEYILNPWASGGSQINPTFVSGNVAISAVPVPAAVWLFGSGLLGLIGVARKKAHA